MKFSKHIYVASLLCLGTVAASAQNIYYSQFHHAQQLTNPASVATSNEMSVMLNYRRQWSNIGNGYSTPALSFAYPLLKGNDVDKRFGGIGVSILQDRAGQNGYVQTTGGTLGYAHNLRLSSKIQVALGLQAGVFQRRLDIKELTSGSQWQNGAFNPDAPILENLGDQNKMFALVNGGLSLYGEDENNEQTFSLGAALYNMNQPETGSSFQNKLSQNLTFTGSVRAWRNDKFSITPNARFVQQSNKNQQLNVGSLFRYHTGYQSHIGLGAWYSADNAVVASLELYQPSYIIGVSYDMGASSLKNGGKNVGAPELALAWRKQIGRKIEKPKDTDQDGVVDTEDSCPLVAGLPELLGCPDQDKDGVADKNDDCIDVAGEKALKGCPDTDKDGIADKNDECPDVFGLVSLKGCPDTDSDGVADKNDTCPSEKGTVENKGCPVLTTLRGTVLDAKTRKPIAANVSIGTSDNQPVANLRSDSLTGAFAAPQMPSKSQGYKIFVSREGFLAESVDVKDEVGKVSKDLNSEILLRAIAVGTKTELKHLNFETSSAKILPESFDELDKWVLWLKDNKKAELEIAGHTDNTGNEKINVSLSKERAVAVKAYLVSKGIKAKRLTNKGYGSAKPVADNNTDAGKLQNRRVELIILKK